MCGCIHHFEISQQTNLGGDRARKLVIIQLPASEAATGEKMIKIVKWAGHGAVRWRKHAAYNVVECMCAGAQEGGEMRQGYYRGDSLCGCSGGRGAGDIRAAIQDWTFRTWAAVRASCAGLRPRLSSAALSPKGSC